MDKFSTASYNHRIEARIKIIISLLLLSSVTGFLASSGGSTTVIPTRGESSTTPRRTQDYITRLAVRKRNAPNVNEEATVDAGIERRKAFLGLLFPLTIAVGANAPFLYVMANPPSAEERDTMLMDFCKGDVCTLLGGGSGFGGGGSGEDYVGEKLAASMPTSEEYEAMAAAAAEKANE